MAVTACADPKAPSERRGDALAQRDDVRCAGEGGEQRVAFVVLIGPRL
jgi:hypothetical protein